MLKNHFYVVLFAEIQLKRKFYSRFLAKASDLVIIECSKSLPVDKTSIQDCLVVQCGSHDLLLQELQAIPQDENPRVNSQYMNTMVIENLSAFYWDLKCLKPRERNVWYSQLNLIIHTIRRKYKCNIIVTGWDNDYERGFNNKSSRPGEPYGLSDLTFLPLDFYRGVERVLAYQTGGSLVFEGNLWRRVKSEQNNNKRPRVEATA